MGRVLKGLTGTQFDLTFIQDRDGMPNFMAERFLESQTAEGVVPHLLERHEIESYLLEPELIRKGALLVGREMDLERIRNAIRQAADGLKARARMKSLETAKLVNRHLTGPRKLDDQELEGKVYQWFDERDLNAIAEIQQIFPGKEILKETLKLLNEGEEKKITRGHLVASLDQEKVASDIRELLTKVSGTNP